MRHEQECLQKLFFLPIVRSRGPEGRSGSFLWREQGSDVREDDEVCRRESPEKIPGEVRPACPVHNAVRPASPLRYAICPAHHAGRGNLRRAGSPVRSERSGLPDAALFRVGIALRLS